MYNNLKLSIMKKLSFIILSIFILVFGVIHFSNASWENPSEISISSTMKNCSIDSDCKLAETACCPCNSGGTPDSLEAINKVYLSQYLQTYNSVCGGVMCPMVYRCPEKKLPKAICENGKCKAIWVDINLLTTSTTTTTTTTTTSTTTTTTTTQPTIHWYKLSNYQNYQQDEWAKTCINSSSAIQASNKYIYCMNLYLNSKNIDFTNLAINTTNSSMYLKANYNFENNLKSIGFIQSLDPDTDVEKPWLNEVEVDLSKQSFFIKENRDNTKIAYRVIDTDIKPKCGDNTCNPIEQYLYELNLKAKCSPLAEKTINFYHCPTDCSDSLDFTNALNLEDFNKLNIKCINSTQEDNTITVPEPQKPIDQMNTTEKNQFIVTLQTYLIQLLTTLLNMLKGVN
jgi:hypothetical protein